MSASAASSAIATVPVDSVPADRPHRQAGGETCGLGGPVRNDRGRRDNQERAPNLVALLGMLDQRERLHRLTQAHVVGQDATEAMPPQVRQPRKAGLLIRAQGGPQAVRGCRLDRGIRVEVDQQRPPSGRRRGLVGQVLEFRPDGDHLVSAESRKWLPLLEIQRFGNEVAQFLQGWMSQGEVAAVDEQECASAPGQGREQRGERDDATVDGDGDAEGEPVGLLGGHDGDRQLRRSGEFAVIRCRAVDLDPDTGKPSDRG